MAATVHERIAAARQALIDAGLSAEDAAIDAAVLARHALGWDRASLLARGREPAPPAFDDVYAQLIRRRTAREPVALITGSREFWGLDFCVSSGVIVPRPETELIVEQALACARDAGSRRLVDVGTGSGCLAVALAAELPGARVLAIDTSLKALRVAALNARRHGVAARVHLVQARLLEAVRAPVHLIVSNPPYVPDTETLPPEIARYEPPEALFAGPDGLDVLRALISSAPARLAPGGRFIVEFGFGQRAAVESLARAAGWSRVGFVNDLQDIPRVAIMEH